MGSSRKNRQGVGLRRLYTPTRGVTRLKGIIWVNLSTLQLKHGVAPRLCMYGTGILYIYLYVPILSLLFTDSLVVFVWFVLICV